MIYIILLLIILIVFLAYKLGKQSFIINKQQKQNENKTNDINVVVDKLYKGKF